MRAKRRTTKAAATGFLVCLAFGLRAKADIFVGLPADPNTGNCFPFSCDYAGEYQQVYSSNQFPGTAPINGLEFFDTSVNSGSSLLNSGTWTISLSTTSANWNTLSSNFAANIGSDNTVLFTGNLGQPWSYYAYPLVINFTKPFDYNPQNGNLLMTVDVTGATGGQNVFFDTSGELFPNTIMGRVFTYGGFTGVQSGYGLVTDFVTPEPSMYLFLPAGILALAGFMARRKSSGNGDGTAAPPH